MKTSNVISLIETLAPSGFAASWDNCGVQIAGPEKEIRKVAVALDPLPQVISDALEWGADFILTHHPLAIDQKLPAELGWFRDVMKQVLCADVTLCAAHTSLDVQFRGVVSWLGRELELSELKVLDPVAKDDSGEILGYGCIGDLESALPFEDFVERVAQATGCEVVALCGPAPEKVRKVAMCPGSGSSFMDKAFAQGADVFITGDVKYHPAQESVGAVLDVGHFSLEEEMMRRFSVVLGQKLENGIEVKFFNGHNPFAYHLLGKGVCKSSAGLL
ncbi:dinuclear metal center protein, YbgI/SA1388 family [Maridesulfovibrio ferrireducens]|uniref:GTP cyclohydrolase 1 type 2 homolog n=1 Tax=Maridesulfovibrio ferrireducens TaxID=246191 RepID=A0A1G9D8J2_9BACT|nr:Nif3-like dinuclear metal center hexameric protein [Maridesulfovibrio ferrireducens]SDK60199.1 dinuclear metal center protein, YbgI/SA1388 family [Maridesulfovibrio ferrireducens]